VYAPYLGASKEFKTKPAQNAVRELRGLGILPDAVVLRTERLPDHDITDKIQLFGGFLPEQVVVVPNARTVYQVPLILEEHGIGKLIMKRLGRLPLPPKMGKWRKLLSAATTEYDQEVHIGIVAKYLNNEDTYFSVVEALQSAAWRHKAALKLHWVDAEIIVDGADSLSRYDGIVVPGGFGPRGVEGKIIAAEYAMSNQLPYLGICLGLQTAVIAAARASGLDDANSTEFNPDTKHNVVYIMESQKGKESTGGSMRLGTYDCVLQPESLAAKLYGATHISERHRHRYEVNQKYLRFIESAGLSVSGKSPDGKLVEMVEARRHPYFVATQAHPEFKSRPDRPHPLFDGLIEAALNRPASVTIEPNE